MPIADAALLDQPIGCADQPVGQQADVEAKLTRAQVDLFFLAGEQIEEQGAHAPFAKHIGDEVVTRAEAAAAAAMRKQHDAQDGV